MDSLLITSVRLINIRRKEEWGGGFLRVDIYIHVSHRGNPRGAGEAMAVLEYIDTKKVAHIREATAKVENETKNALTLEVIVAALKKIVKPCEVVLHMENEYIKSCVALGWLENWRQAEWIKANGKPPANIELWKMLYISMQIHKIIFLPYEERQEFNNKI